jgi:DNA replication protein DnaC
MASGYAELLQNISTVEVQQTEWLLRHLIQAEQTDRGLRSIRYQMYAARFPMHRDLAGFKFEQSKVDRLQIEQFATTAFTDCADNIVLIGGTGTCKTHLASALGVQAITRHGKRVRFL